MIRRLRRASDGAELNAGSGKEGGRRATEGCEERARQSIRRRASICYSDEWSRRELSESRGTMGCKASLQNNIGAIMSQNIGSMEEARDRFHAAILVSDGEENSGRLCPGSPSHKARMLVHADKAGLTWFHNKLRHESCTTHAAAHSGAAADRQFPSLQKAPSASSGVAAAVPAGAPTVGGHHPMVSWKHAIERCIPLGLEYVSLPLHVAAASPAAADARCAAYLNLARIRLEFPRLYAGPPAAQCQTAGGGQRLVEQVLALCEASLDPPPNPLLPGANPPALAHARTYHAPLRRHLSERSVYATHSHDTNAHPRLPLSPTESLHGGLPVHTINTISPSLQIIATNNLGALCFSLNRLKEALQHFESAFDIISNILSTPSPTSPTSPTSPPSSPIKHPKTDPYPVLPYDYLHLITLFNLTRIYIRINQLTQATKYINIISNLPSTLPTPNTLSSPWNPHTTPLSHKPHHLHHHHQHQHHLLAHRYKYLISLSQHYHHGLLKQRQEHLSPALEHYNALLSLCRRELGHNHIYVATVLEKKAKVLFDQQKLQTAMLSYLASLRVYEKQFTNAYQEAKPEQYLLERSRVLYEIGRTLHDREEYADALRVYQKALSMRLRHSQNVEHGTKSIATMKDAIKILTNIGRMNHIMGDLDEALKANLEIATMAISIVRGGEQQGDYVDDDDDDVALQHAFVRNQFVTLGNLYVEAGRFREAMEVFSRISRQQQRRRQRQQQLAGASGSDDLLQNHARPEEEDVDTTSAFVVSTAERFGSVGGSGTRPHTASAA